MSETAMAKALESDAPLTAALVGLTVSIDREDKMKAAIAAAAPH